MDAKTELKIISDNGSSFVVGGYGVHFGDADLSGDRFTKSTDFWFDRITQNPPVLYQHGQDSMLKRTPVGRVTSTRVDDIGVWIEAQITAAKQYGDMIRQLVAKGVLGWSSGSVPHLVQRVKSTTPGVTEITSWPIVEFSLTPTPAEPRTVGVKELKSLAAADPLLLPIAREAEQAQATKEAKAVELPDSAFAFIEDGVLDAEKKTFTRNRHYPHHDESGTVDLDAVATALTDAIKSDRPAFVVAHLKRHLMAAESGGQDDAHSVQWSEGAAPEILANSLKMMALAEKVAGDRLAMERLGMDTKSGARLNTSGRTELKDLHSSIGQRLEWADNIERGEDGKSRVDMFRHRLAMLELEEVS